MGHSDCFKIRNNTVDIVGNVIVVLGIDQGAAFAFLQKLRNIGRGKLLVDGNNNVVTAHNGKISENPLIAVFANDGDLVSCAVGIIEMRCELLHIIVKLIVCNGGFTLAAFATEKHLIAVFTFYKDKKLLEGFVGGYGVMGKRIISHNCLFS